MAGYKRQLNEPRDMAALFQDMKSIPYPFVVTVRQGADRTLAQNRLLHRWFTEIAQHYGDRTEAEVKAQCNLQYGRPILMQDNDEWSAAFSFVFDALNLPSKLKAIRVLDVPFTRIMGVRQLTKYMKQMSLDYRDEGVVLTDPEMLKYG
tara:strand:- start:108 stop:554 length:447 start_codon:yes stop_codon:yes gene_type:complete